MIAVKARLTPTLQLNIYKNLNTYPSIPYINTITRGYALPVSGSANVLIKNMKIIIFDDKQNSEASLRVLNYGRALDDKRFWRLEKFHDFLYQKTKELFTGRCNDLKLVRTYAYTGTYTPQALNSLKKQCGEEIRRMNDLIKREEELLKQIRAVHKDDELRTRIEQHVTYVKSVFEEIKVRNQKAIEKHTRGVEGQRKLIANLETHNFFQWRTTPLRARNGFIHQKGVDVKLSTDLIQLAHANAYDAALLITGDSDLAESIKLVRDTLGRIIILCAYFERPNSRNNTVSEDLIKNCDHFININDFNEDEILKISDKLIPKTPLSDSSPTS